MAKQKMGCMGCLGMLFLGFIGLGIIGVIANPNGSNRSTAVKTEKQAQKQPQASKPQAFQQGQTVTIGYTSYKVNKAWWSSSLSPNQFLNKKPNAMWLFVDVSVRNNDKQARTIPPFKLLDAQGAEYEASPNGWAVEGSIGVLDSLNPGVSQQGFVVFDVPQNKKYQLRVSGGFWSGEEAKIQLSPK